MAICRETSKQILHGVYPEHNRRIQDDRYVVMLSEAKHLLFLFHYSITPVLQHSKPFRSHVEENRFILTLEANIETVDNFPILLFAFGD